MSDSLRKHLSDLHIAVQSQKDNEGSQLINDIKLMVKRYRTMSELELCASLLFNDEYNILKFMRKTHYITELPKCIENSLILIQEITTSWNNLSSFDVGKISSTIVEIYPSCKSSSQKEKIIQILISMVKKTQSEHIDCKTIKKIFREELDTKSKSSSSVKCAFLHLFGLLCQYYPNELQDQFDRMVTLYLRKLQHEFHRSSDLKIIEGCLKGLSCILYNYKVDSKSQCEDIFKFSMKSMQPKEGHSRHAITIAGLKIIRHHVHQFDWLLVEHYEKVYDVLVRWLKSVNGPVKHEAHLALLSFLKQIVEVVGKDSGVSNLREIYTFFMKKFQMILESTNLSSKEVSISIRGYGLFAKLCHRYKDDDYLCKMLSVMMSRTAVACFSYNGKQRGFQIKLDQLYQMSNFLSSLARILKEAIGSSEEFFSDNHNGNSIITEQFLSQVMQICLHVAEGFHLVPTRDHAQISFSLISLMSSLSTCPDHLHTFVSEFVSQVLDANISGNVKTYLKLLEANMQNTEEIVDMYSDSRMEKSPSGSSDQVTYKNHMDIKKSILKEILQSIHKMLKKLELDNEEEACDMKSVSNPKTIMKELAMFWERFLFSNVASIEKLSREIFASQAFSMTETLLRMASSSQLSIGSYNMLTAIVNTCSSLGYFSSPFNMDMDNAGTAVRRCKKLIAKSLPEIVGRLPGSDVEAASAALLFLLSLPSEFTMNILDMLVKPLQMAFLLGLGNVNLADAALNALDKWKSSEESGFPICFVKVLSDIALYISGDDLQNAEIKLPVSTHKVRDETSSTTGKTMKEVKKKALQFLRSVRGFFPISPLAKDVDLKKVYLKSDIPGDPQTYTFSLPGTAVKLPLSDVFAHVCELAKDSTDRQTKLTACEVLYSIVVLSIGQLRQGRFKESSSAWAEVYQCVIPEVIRLGCDSDPITKTLFESLVMQIIHWFAEDEGANSGILLDIITSGLVDESNEFRRNFYTRCLGDFVTSIATQYGDSNDVAIELSKPIFQQLCNFASHPDPDIRRSAAVSFSALHNIIGESKKLLDEWIFQLLSAFISSLALSHSDPSAVGAIMACSEALLHIENLIIANKDMLLWRNVKRKGFPGLEDNVVCLETVVEWLLKQSARTESACRKFCMRSFMELSTLLPKFETFHHWMQGYIEQHGADYLCSMFNGNITIMHTSMKSDTTECWTIKQTKRYLESLLPGLDCYCWAISNRLLSPDELIKGLVSEFLHCVDHFISQILFSERHCLVGEQDQALLHEVEILTEKKFEVAQKTLELVHLMFQPQFVREEFVTEPVLHLLASCLLDPVHVGFDVAEESGKLGSFSVLLSSMISCTNEWPEGIKQKWLSSFHNRSALNEIFIDPVEYIKRSNCRSIFKLIRTYRILLKSGCLQVLLPEMTVDKQHTIAQNILKIVFSPFANPMDSSETILWNGEIENENALFMLLKLAFNLGVKANDLADMISGNSLLVNRDSKKVSMQITMLFSKYKTVLCEEICTHSEKYLPAMSNRCTAEMGIRVINGVIDILSGDRIMYGDFASKFVESVLTHWWDHIIQLTMKESARGSALSLFSKLISLHPQVASDVNNPKYQAIFDVFSSTLKSKVLTLQAKNEVLPCLQYFVLPNRHVFSENLRSCLFEFCSIHFPSKSTEFQEGSQQLNDYLTSLKHILVALEKTGSPEIMSVLAPVLCREPKHILKDEFVNVLRMCVHCVPDNVQQGAIDRLYTLYYSSPHSVTVRCRIGDMMLLPVLSQSNRESIEAFFVSRIGEIMGCIAEDLKKGSTDSWKDKLSMKSVAYKLVEVMFRRLPKDLVTSESSPLVAAFASSDIGQGSTKMLKNFMSWILRDKSMDIKVEKKLFGEELRQFSCCVFNAVIAAVMCTQTEMKWFDAFIFSYNPKKNDNLFENIVDESKVYEFPRFKTSEKYIHEMLTKTLVKTENETYEPTISSISSFRYDAAQFDMNAPTSSASNVDVDSKLDHEEDAMNQHECMHTLISAVFYMKDKSIGFPVEYTSNATLHPPAKWMIALTQRMNSDPCINVKIFIVKLILNCSSKLEPYCNLFLVPMIKVMVQYMKSHSTSNRTSKIDQFVVDALATILSWNYGEPSNENQEEKLHLRALVEILMQHCPSADQGTFKRNLKLFDATLGHLKKRLSNINTDFIYHYSAGSSTKNTETLQSLHLLVSLLRNGFSPYSPSIDVPRLDYFGRVFGYLLQSSKVIVDVVSVIIGMSLRYLSRHHNESDGEIHDSAKTVLRNLGNSAKSQGPAMTRFISSLLKVATYYPPIVMPFIRDILYLLPKVPSPQSKIYCVETVRICMSSVDDTIAELKAKDFLDMLIHRNEDLQYSCMKLLNQLVDLSISSVKEGKFDVEHFNDCIVFFLPHVKYHIVGDQSFMCRQEMYTIAMKLQTFQLEWKSTSDHHSHSVFNDSKYILIRGLGDSKEVLRLQVMNFWADNLHLIAKCDMSDLGGKLMALFKYLYTPEADELGFLASCCDILMRSACQNPNFSHDIFSRSVLFNCQYQDLPISQYLDSNQKSVKSSHDLTTSKESELSMMETDPKIHKNQTAASPQGTYNWMTGETYSDTVETSKETLTTTQYSDSDMSGVERRRRDFLKNLATHDRSTTKALRFPNNREGSHESRMEKIRMYRAYRTGKLPDLKISHSDVLIPLTALTQYSPNFLRCLMSTLINAILGDKKRSRYVEDFSTVLETMLSKSKQHNPTFIACILTIILANIESLSIDISVVSQVAKKSGQIQLGIRIIEEKLLLDKETSEPRRKRRKVSDESSEIGNEELNEWMSLARLYSNDFVMLRGIFSIPSISGSQFKKVMHLESEGEYKQALKYYEEALTEESDSQTNEVEKTLWEDSLINCLEKLTKWSDVDKFCMKQLDGSLGNATDKPDSQERFLLPSLHAKSYLMMNGSLESREELWKFLADSLTEDEVEKKIIERDHCYLIALVQAHKSDFGQANFYLDLALDRIGTMWKAHDKRMVMSQLMHITDLGDYLQLTRRGTLSASLIETLCLRWSQRLPCNQVDSVNVWEDMSTNRCYFLDHLVQSLSMSTEKSLLKLVAEFKIDMYIDAVDQACEEKCFNKAGKFINENVTNILQSFSSTDETNFLGFLKHSLGLGKYYLNYAHHLMALNKGPQYLREAASDLVKAYKCLKEASQSQILNEHQSRRSTVFTLLGQNLRLMMDLVEYKNLDPSVLQIIDGLIGSGTNIDLMGKMIGQEGFDVMKKTVDETSKSGHVTNNCVEMFITFAKLCDQVLQKKDISPAEDITDNEESKLIYVKEVIRNTLRAMQYGGKHDASLQAVIKFPRLLQLVEQFPEAKEFFCATAEEVPLWMFIKWISQMIAILDKPESDAVHSIVYKLGEEYPQAVIYAAKTSVSQFQFEKSDSGKNNKKFVDRLLSHLDSLVPKADKFINNLIMLANPFHIFKNWYDTSVELLLGGTLPSQSLLFTNYQNMYNELFASHAGDSTLQTLHARFAREFRDEVEKAFGGPTGGHVLLKRKIFQKATVEISKKMKDFSDKNKPSSMKSYSHWLANFHITSSEGELEIPGQYHKVFRKPMPEYHIKIMGFEDSVLVMSSLQQPKKIIVRGTDSKKYPYLVKGNEDLRQDQRIQQLFETVNIALQGDPECFKRDLKVETYQVIPVTDRLGLVEWVENSPTIQDILSKELKRTNRDQCLKRAYDKYLSWLSKYKPAQSSTRMVDMYGNMMKCAKLKDVSDAYHTVITEIPPFILRETLQRRCINPETFLALRKRFVSTYGTLCAVHWILGIGDRHSGNCLISENGSVVGIDFGHAFSSATEILPVPELVPFRLTSQICNVMVPHPIKNGLLRQCMLYSLHSLRRNQETILAMLDIFLKEPSVDWIKRAGKLMRQQESSSGKLTGLKNTSLAWYPSKKIEHVKAKLQGGNPVFMLREELHCNSSVSSYVEYYRAVADASTDDIRLSQSSSGLSIDQQVDRLLRLATDPNILGRTYHGWKFWL